MKCPQVSSSNSSSPQTPLPSQPHPSSSPTLSLSQYHIPLAIISYSLCSSTLLLANKLTMIYLPRPSLISLIQIVFSLLVMFILFVFFKVPYDQLETSKVQKYLIYVLTFTISRYANMKALQQSNVDTIIIFRSCIPLTISILEYYFLNRLFLSPKSFLSLVVIFISAIIYCYHDSNFLLNGYQAYSWVMVYFLLLTFELTYCKVLMSSVALKTNWGPVYYCNLLAVIPMTILCYLVGDLDGDIWEDISQISFTGILIILFSCVAGTFIG
jgi:solute carrier family 35